MAEQKDEQKVKKISRIKVQKKLWYKILAPKVLANREIGETYLTAPNVAVGRKIRINLREITGNVKDQNCYVVLQINGVSGNQLTTALIGYELTSSGVKRAVRKNIDRLDDFFNCKTKTGKNVVVKTLMVTIGHTQRSKRSMLRKLLKESLQEEISKSDVSTLITNLVTQRIQSATRKKLNKIYPLRELAIKYLRVVEAGVAQEEMIVQDVSTETASATPEDNKAESKEDSA
jgi:ribosomal protein S3AE